MFPLIFLCFSFVSPTGSGAHRPREGEGARPPVRREGRELAPAQLVRERLRTKPSADTHRACLSSLFVSLSFVFLLLCLARRFRFSSPFSRGASKVPATSRAMRGLGRFRRQAGGSAPRPASSGGTCLSLMSSNAEGQGGISPRAARRVFARAPGAGAAPAPCPGPPGASGRGAGPAQTVACRGTPSRPGSAPSRGSAAASRLSPAEHRPAPPRVAACPQPWQHETAPSRTQPEKQTTRWCQRSDVAHVAAAPLRLKKGCNRSATGCNSGCNKGCNACFQITTFPETPLQALKANCPVEAIFCLSI